MGSRTVVIGGGNAAVDAARTARRQGAAAGHHGLPGVSGKRCQPLPEELAGARQEGIDLRHRWGVRRILGEGKVTGLELKAVARVFDDQGRFAPVYVEDRLETLAADTVLVAIGQTPDFNFFGPGWRSTPPTAAAWKRTPAPWRPEPPASLPAATW